LTLPGTLPQETHRVTFYFPPSSISSFELPRVLGIFPFSTRHGPVTCRPSQDTDLVWPIFPDAPNGSSYNKDRSPQQTGAKHRVRMTRGIETQAHLNLTWKECSLLQSFKISLSTPSRQSFFSGLFPSPINPLPVFHLQFVSFPQFLPMKLANPLLIERFSSHYAVSVQETLLNTCFFFL